MKIQCLNGGPWFLNDPFFFVNQIHNGYELEKVFEIQANLLSHYFDADLGFHVEMIAKTANYKTHNPFNGKVYQIPSNEFHPEIMRFPSDTIYYHGYWINPKWFRSYKDILRKELNPPRLIMIKIKPMPTG